MKEEKCLYETYKSQSDVSSILPQVNANVNHEPHKLTLTLPTSHTS